MHDRDQQRPDGPAPEDQGRRPLDVVFATSLDGRVYQLPLEVAQRYELTGEVSTDSGHFAIIPRPSDDEDEVGGRHQMMHPDGRLRYHTSWGTGAYIWKRDYRSYSGPHWHPNPASPLALDMRDY